jgi:glycosyltransferase involved in cell wall biosynthesis
MKKKIAIIDLNVTISSPAGSCVRSEILGLLQMEDLYIDLYTSKCDISHPRLNIKIIKVFENVMLLKYLTFYLKCFFKVEKGYDLIQTTQGQYSYSDITYAHFCHKAYLSTHWQSIKVKGIRKFLRYLNHTFQAFFESISFENSSLIVVPSEGLKREISFYYPNSTEKIKIISNPVDLVHYEIPNTFEKNEERQKLGFSKDDFVIVFSALGDFSRKGLDVLYESLTILKNTSIKILVIGGSESEINSYKLKANRLQIESQIMFVGFKKDIRHFLWIGDIFSLPSTYETFSLVAAQAAAAGLPILVTKLYGVEDYVIDGINGWVVDRNPKIIAEVITNILNYPRLVDNYGLAIKESIKKYDTPYFYNQWNKTITDMRN